MSSNLSAPPATGTEALARLGVAVIPPVTLEEGARRLADFVALCLLGSERLEIRHIRDHVRALGGAPQATVVGDGRAPAPSAAIVNGAAVHGAGLDDFHAATGIHPMVTVVPAALAAAQLAGAPGRRLVEAIVFGYEVASRLGRTTARGIIHSRGFHPTSTIGTVAAAGAAAAALDLPPDRTAHALAVAAGRCAGLFHFAPDSWTKPLQAGWAAGAGVDSALLASHGFTGPLSILEGRHGLLQALAGDGAYEPSGLFAPAGSWAIHEVSYKPYAHSTELHVAVDALIEALADFGHDAVSIDRIEVALRPAACRVTTEPAVVKHRPATSRDAQQSAYFAIAVAAHAGRTRTPCDSFYQWFEPDRLHCPEVLDLAARVVVRPDPALEVAAGDASPARVSVMTRGGRRADRTLAHHRGSPARPFTWEDLEARFVHLTGRVHQLGPVRTVLGSESVEAVAALLGETRSNEEGTRGGR